MEQHDQETINLTQVLATHEGCVYYAQSFVTDIGRILSDD